MEEREFLLAELMRKSQPLVDARQRPFRPQRLRHELRDNGIEEQRGDP
jgi:hypothetical protein